MRGGSPRNKGQKSKNGFRIAGQSLAILNPFPQTGVCSKKAVTIPSGPTRLFCWAKKNPQTQEGV
jgi:hypothetical protein